MQSTPDGFFRGVPDPPSRQLLANAYHEILTFLPFNAYSP